VPDYRRNRVPGGTYFFTVALLDRRSSLLVERIADLRAAVRTVKQRYPFHIDAWVVLPEHIHAIWTLPAEDADFSGRWREIKKAFVKPMALTERRSDVRKRRGERGIWQRRFWEHTIRDEHDYEGHMDYVHFNPVKHGLAVSAAAWPFSSFHRCVANRIYPANWAADGADLPDAGERG
jgi:putative transposase